MLRRAGMCIQIEYSCSLSVRDAAKRRPDFTLQHKFRERAGNMSCFLLVPFCRNELEKLVMDGPTFSHESINIPSFQAFQSSLKSFSMFLAVRSCLRLL